MHTSIMQYSSERRRRVKNEQKSNEGVFRCILHGSFQKYFTEIQRIRQLFVDAGIDVLAPDCSPIVDVKDGFTILSNDGDDDPRMIELRYLHNLKRLGDRGFSYFVNPGGYIGKSASYELGIAQISNSPCFFLESLADHPAYVHGNAVWKPELLAEYVAERHALPEPCIRRNEKTMHKVWQDLMVPWSVVAVGGIIEYVSRKPRKEKEILLVKTHKWGGRYSVIGEKVKRNERLDEAFVRGIYEESGLRADIGPHICTFDQIKQSGYYRAGVQHIFVDKVAYVRSKRVSLNEEAEEYIWITPQTALNELLLEPNARYTLELYTNTLV